MTPATEYVWGIDPAVGKVAFAFASLGDDSIVVETLITANDEREGKRLGWLDRQVRIYARQIASTYPPAVVWVEQPSGRFPNLPLTYAVGVIQAALFEALEVPVWSVTSGMWKKTALGYGNASKAQVSAWVANDLRLDANSQDEADACAIAWAGRDMFVRREFGAAA